MGKKYLKPALERALRRGGDKLERACDKLLEDAAGLTKVERVAVVDKQLERYRLEIDPADRQRALNIFADRLDGKPLQEVAVEAGSIANVIVLRAKLGEDPEMPESVKEILRAKEADSGLGDEEPEDDHAE